MKRTTKKTLFVFVLIAAMMLSIFPAAAFAEGAAAVEPAAQTEQQPEKDAAPAAKDDGAKPAEPAKDDGAKPAEPVKDGENKAEPVKNDEKPVVVEGKDGEKPADPELKDGDEKGEPEEKDDGEEPVKEEENTGAAPKTPEEENGDEKAEEEKDVPAVSDAVRAFLAAASAFTMPEDVMALTDEECQTLAAQIYDLFVMYLQLSEEDLALPEVQAAAAVLNAAYAALDARNTAEVLLSATRANTPYNSVPLNIEISSYGAPFISGSSGEHSVYIYRMTKYIERTKACSGDDTNASGSITARFVGSNETGWTLVVDIVVGNYSETVTTGARITNKDMSAATGYITFGMSWDTQNGNKEPVSISGSAPLPATNVDAILNYDANGGTGAPKSESKSGPKGSSATFTVSSTTPTRDGYTFKGWNTDPSGNGTAYEAGKTISVAYGSTTTLYAQWEEKSAPGPNPPTDLLETKLIYNANAADAVNVDPAVVTQNVAHGEKAQFIVTSDKPTRPGYTFAGWSIIPDAEVAYNPDSVVEVEAGAEMILYAVWVKNVKLEIIYNGNADGVQNIPGPDVEWVEPNGSFVFTIANGPTRPGYRFVEWNSADNGTGDSIKPGQTTRLYAGETGYSKTYYAKWEKATDEAALDFEPNANGDTSVGNMPSKMTDTVDKGTNAQFTVPTAPPTRAGYVFKHWNTAANDSGDTREPGSMIEVPAGTTTILYAQWVTGMNTTLVYDANLGTGAPDAESKDVAGGTDGEFIVSDVEPTRYGYKFVGWTENSDGSGQKYKNPDTIKIPAGQTKTIYAQWELELTQMEVPVKLQVIFNGLDSLPSDFAYSVTGADGNVALKGTLTKAGKALVGTSHAYYYVTDAPVTLDVDKDYTFTFTQSGYQIDGYTWSGNVTETLTGKVLPENRENGLVLTIVNNYTKEEVTPIDWGKLGISKSVSPTGPVKPGTTLTYTITVTNNTGADLDSVVVYDKLDRHLTFVSATGTGSYSTLTGFWNVGALANGASAALVIKATVNAGTADKTVIYNTASVLAASSGNEALKVGSGPSASANVAVTNPGSGTWGGTTWGKGVQTGDDANLGLWIAAMIVSFLCVAALVYVNMKRIFKGKANSK
ncbi:MAG: InlB B-repeat-containing protein [Eubacteriales bacterium]|nr:InlB B-repeat-containing protein [Eubacteriales bacterium]